MKKALLYIVFIAFLLCGCSVPAFTSYEYKNIEGLKGCAFQFNEETNDYSLFFGLFNKNSEYVSADVDVDIRIVNDEEEEVYKGTKSVKKNDFNNYTSQAAGEQYLAQVKIPAADITAGKSTNGKVYLTVYKNDALHLNEVNCIALYCLPISDVKLIFDTLPLKIDVKDDDGSIESTIQIDDITYSFEKRFFPQLKIMVSGAKIYGKPDSLSFFDMISYKLYDSEEHMITSGELDLDSLNQGDKFQDDSIVFNEITPGETYRIVFSEYHW